MIKVYGDISPVDILAFGIHPDDVELSASGTILSEISKGRTVGICDLTRGELGSRGTPETRHQEAIDASEILGINWRVNLGMPDGFAYEDKERILSIAEVIRLAKPKILLANAIEDRHPDHPRGARLVREAHFFSGLSRITSIQGEAHRADHLYYYIQDKQLMPDFCVDVTLHVDQKMKSIVAYKTQFFQGDETDAQGVQTPISGSNYLDLLKAKMRVFGRYISTDYAEGFNCDDPIKMNQLISD